MRPEFLYGGEAKLPAPTDQELAREAILEFFGPGSRYPEHNQAMIDKFEEYNLLTPGLETAVQLHDIVDHGLISPKNEEDRRRATEIINNLYRKVVDPEELTYALGCAISAATWESDVAETWRFAGDDLFRDRSPEDQAQIDAAIHKNPLVAIDEKILKSARAKLLDTTSLSNAIDHMDIEGLQLLAVELMHNLDNPPPNNPASTWRDCNEILNCYVPALELFGSNELASELCGKALKYFYDDPEVGEKAQAQLEASLHHFADIDDKVPEVISESLEMIANEHGISGLRGKTYVYSRIKTEGSLRKKFSSDEYKGIDQLPDGIGYRIVVLDGMLEKNNGFNGEFINDLVIELGKEVRSQLTSFNSEDTPEQGYFVAEHTKDSNPEENYIQNPKSSGYSAFHLALQYKINGETIPVEIQVVTSSQEIQHIYDTASSVLYKAGTEPSQRIINDLKIIESRAESIRSKLHNQELNVHTLFKILDYLPNIETPLNKHFTVENVGNAQVMVPHELSDLVKRIDPKGLDGDIIIPPGSLTVDDFKFLIGLISPALKDDENINTAIEFLASQKLPPRRNGKPQLENHLLPTAFHALAKTVLAGEYWESNDPHQYCSDIVSGALMHDFVEDIEGDREAQLRWVEDKFNQSVSEIVRTMSSPKHIKNAHARRTAYAKQLAEIPRVLSIKNSDRSHNIVTDLIKEQSSKTSAEARKKITEYLKKTLRYNSAYFDSDIVSAEHRNTHKTVMAMARVLYPDVFEP